MEKGEHNVRWEMNEFTSSDRTCFNVGWVGIRKVLARRGCDVRTTMGMPNVTLLRGGTAVV